jgi:hypothetical protein
LQGCGRSFSREDNLWSHQRDKHEAWNLIKLPTIALPPPPPTAGITDDDLTTTLQAALDADFEGAMECMVGIV